MCWTSNDFLMISPQIERCSSFFMPELYAWNEFFVDKIARKLISPPHESQTAIIYIKTISKGHKVGYKPMQNKISHNSEK